MSVIFAGIIKEQIYFAYVATTTGIQTLYSGLIFLLERAKNERIYGILIISHAKKYLRLFHKEQGRRIGYMLPV